MIMYSVLLPLILFGIDTLHVTYTIVLLFFGCSVTLVHTSAQGVPIIVGANSYNLEFDVYLCVLAKNQHTRKKSLRFVNTLAQSICTHYSCFENQGRFVTLKKNWAPCFLKKAGCKKPRSLLFKKRRGSLVFSLFE